MLFVEDALKLIAAAYAKTHGFGGRLASDWHLSFLQNVADHIDKGRSLSTEQSRIIIKILGKVKTDLVAAGEASEEAIEYLIQHPIHRQTPHQSANIRKEVRHLGANFIGFRFKFNDMIMRDIRAMASPLTGTFAPWFDRDYRIWVVPISRHNLNEVREVIARHRFEMDTSTRDYLALAQCSKDKPSTVVHEQDSGCLILNVCDDDMLIGWAKNVAGSRYL